MFWLSIFCVVLCCIVLILLYRIHMLRYSAKEIRQGLLEKLSSDTNTLLRISSNDREMRRLAKSLNDELRLLREERCKYQSGNQKLKDSITNISHDLRTPLTVISGYMELLRDEETSEKVTNYLSIIDNRTQTMKELTEELFRYAVGSSIASDQISLKATNMNVIIEEALASFYTSFKEAGIRPTIIMPKEFVYCYANHEQLIRVLYNILSNLLKYSDGDAEICLTKNGRIVISNTATRLNEVQTGKLFDRFYTVETAINSTGLGLSIAKSLMEQMNGRISALYKDNKLYITLTLSQ